MDGHSKISLPSVYAAVWFPYACGGVEFGVTSTSRAKDEALAYAASVARYAFDLADWDNSGWVVPHGVSGVRGAGHDMDQRQLWLDCDLLPMAFSDEAVKEIEASYHQM